MTFCSLKTGRAYRVLAYANYWHLFRYERTMDYHHDISIAHHSLNDAINIWLNYGY